MSANVIKMAYELDELAIFNEWVNFGVLYTPEQSVDLDPRYLSKDVRAALWLTKSLHNNRFLTIKTKVNNNECEEFSLRITTRPVKYVSVYRSMSDVVTFWTMTVANDYLLLNSAMNKMFNYLKDNPTRNASIFLEDGLSESDLRAIISGYKDTYETFTAMCNAFRIVVRC